VIRCVVFDLDGTLVDIGDLFYRIFAEVVRARGLAPLSFDKHGDPWVSAHAQTLAAYPQLRGVAAEPSFADTWERVLTDMLADGEVRVYPEAWSVLEQVHAAGRSLCLASNTPKRFVGIKLEVLGIARLFDAVFTPQDRWGGKPKPDSLLYMMERFGLAPSEVLMVGDHDQDIVYGKNASVRTAAVLSGYGNSEELEAAEPDFLLANISMLPWALCNADRIAPLSHPNDAHG